MNDVPKEKGGGLTIAMYSFLFLVIGLAIFFIGLKSTMAVPSAWIGVIWIVSGVVIIISALGTLFGNRIGVYLIFVMMFVPLILSAYMLYSALNYTCEGDGDDDCDDSWDAIFTIIFGCCFGLSLLLLIAASTGFSIIHKPAELERPPPLM